MADRVDTNWVDVPAAEEWVDAPTDNWVDMPDQTQAPSFRGSGAMGEWKPKAGILDMPGIAGRGLVRAELGAAKSVLGTLDAMINMPEEQVRRTVGGMFGGPGAGMGRTPEEIRERTAPIREAKRRVVSAQERFDVQYSGGLAWGTRVVSEAIPYMANAMAAGAVAGPVGAATVGFIIEGDNAYDEAKASGATDAQANTERVIVGSINAGIEALQIGRLLNFSKSGKHSLKAFIKSARDKGIKAAGGELKGFGAAALRLSIENAIEEFVQEGVSVGTPALLRGEYPKKADGSPDYWAIANRLGEAAAGGALAGPILGEIGSAVAGQTPTETTPEVEAPVIDFQPVLKAAETVVEDKPITTEEKNTLKGAGFTTSEILSMRPTDARAMMADPVAQSLNEDEQNPTVLDKADAYEITDPGVLLKYATSKRILMQRIGADKYTKQLLDAKEAADVLKHTLRKDVNRAIRALKKQASLGDKIASKIMNRQTKPVDRMVDMLDSYERLPDAIAKDLAPVEVDAFNKLRDMLEWAREEANVVRKQLDLPEIAHIKAYIPHWSDTTASEVIAGTYPYKTGFIAGLAGKVAKLPAEQKNRTALHRELSGKIEKFATRDLQTLMNAVMSYDVHDMLVARPFNQVKEELQDLHKRGKIHDRALEEIGKYLDYDILDKQERIDKAFNAFPTVKTSTEMLNKVLRPLNREINNPANFYFGGMRRIMHAAFLPFRPRPVTRNVGQRLLNLTFYRARDLLRAQFGKQDLITHPKTGDQIKILDYVREQNWYKLTKPEDTLNDNSLIARLTATGMIGFKLSHVGNRYTSNVEVSALTAYYDWKHRFEQSHDTESKHYKQIVKHSKEAGIPIEQLQTQSEDMMDDIRDGVQMTQWEYMSHNMPTIFRGQTKRAIGAYQSWWMNYFMSHTAEGWNRLMTGRTRVRGDGTGGRLLTPYARLRAVKGIGAVYGMGRIAKQTLGVAMLTALFMPDPQKGGSLILQLAGHMAKIFLGTANEKEKAWGQLKKLGVHLLPFSNAARDAAKLSSGDWTLKDYVFYTNNKEWQQIWVPVQPKKK